MLRWRYGARTFGLLGYDEFGLGHLGPDAVAGWSRRFFTAGNATLWSSGPLPAHVRLDLPPGERIPAPLESNACPELPAWYAEGSGAASMHTVVPRSTAAVVLEHVLSERLTTRLRYEHGASYAPGSSYEPRTGSDATLFAVIDAVEGHDAVVCAELIDALPEIASGACEQRSIDTCRSHVMSGLSEPGLRRGFLHARCWDELQGADELRFDEWMDSVAALRPADVCEVAAHAAAAALYRLPQGQAPQNTDLAAAPTQSGRLFDGQTFPQRRMSRDDPLHILTVAAEGVSFASADGVKVSVPYDECEALLKWPDGHRVLMGADAFTLEIDPRRWVDGAAVPPAVDAAVPPDRHVEMPPVATENQGPAPVMPEPRKQWIIVAVLAVGTLVGLVLLLTVGFGSALWFGIWCLALGRQTLVLRELRAVRGLRGVPRTWSSPQ